MLQKMHFCLFNIHIKGDDIIFTTLTVFGDKNTLSTLESIIKNYNSNIPILSASTVEEANNISSTHDIHLIVVCIDSNPREATNFIFNIQNNGNFQFVPIIIVSTKIEHLVTAFLHFKFCEYILLPFDKETCSTFSEYIKFFFSVYEKLEYNKNMLHLDTSRCYHNIPLEKILFVEAVQHKCIIHTSEDSIPVNLPLYKLKKCFPLNLLKQTHRSYLVNLDNIIKIDKTREPWTIHFRNCSLHALISRTYKKDVLNCLPIKLKV